MIGKRIICISGFSQDFAHPSGIEVLWERLRQSFSNFECCVTMYPWRSDWKAIASHIVRTGRPTGIDVRVAAYSWGAGHGFVKLALALMNQGVNIKVAVLSDPVYRNAWMLWRSLWSPILGEPVISIPENVGKVLYLRQQMVWPHGHKCVSKSGKTAIEDHGFLVRPHVWMDDAREFHDLAWTNMS